MVNTWDKDYVKYNERNVEPVHISFSGSGDTGKSHFVKLLYNAILKRLLYQCKDPYKFRVLLLGPTSTPVVKIAWIIIHLRFRVKPKKVFLV